MKMSMMMIMIVGAMFLYPSASAQNNYGSTCFLPPQTGMCRARFINWYYDHQSGTCRTFTYGGCGGNGNNFMNFNECMAACHQNPSHNEITY
ncbi:Kunitz-type serine protease inhibitor BmKTT-2-like [Homarus americanus]|uniref:Kunitz-type serine protease inhibitor BmKTT-2-like n=1 Tax=Homarus americanus TaxID=6706 RepID=A0A8J5N520_HOMAM|nr:Kunitz-type serine protease inhibitor BmKTT-2-like [Homarus americanus]